MRHLHQDRSEPGSDDVANAYRLFLGRPPEAEYGNQWSSPADLVQHFVNSEEFHLFAAQPIVKGHFPPPDRFAGEPASEMRLWMSSFLPVSARSRGRLGQAVRWEDALRLLFSDRKFTRAVTVSDRNWSLERLAASLADQEGSHLKRRVGMFGRNGLLGGLVARWTGSGSKSATIMSSERKTGSEFSGEVADHISVDLVNRLSERTCRLGPNGYDLMKDAFSYSYYKKTNPDLTDLGIDGDELLDHYILEGVGQGRDPHPDFSTNFYLQKYSDVAQSGINPFGHYLEIGRAEGRLAKPPTLNVPDPVFQGPDGSIWQGYDDVRHAGIAGENNPSNDREALAYTTSLRGIERSQIVGKLIGLAERTGTSKPTVSIIIPCYDQWIYTAECLAAVFSSDKHSPPYEVIIVDNGSSEPFYSELGKICGLTILGNSENLGFGPACNQGAAVAAGAYLLILNNDTQIDSQFLHNMVLELEADEGVAVVVPKVLSFDGTLQEAGCVITHSGKGRFVGMGDDHRRPRYNYARDLDYGSAVALMIRSKTFFELKGFDDAYAPAYYEDVDLCMRVTELGKRIRYIPTATVAHHLSKTSNSDNSDRKMDLVTRNKQIFLDKWQRKLLDEKLRLIAFYLPQYHPIKENDRWWGKGFTEWRNVAKAKANYKDHHQPRTPAGLGYYDLRSIDSMEEQVKLAKRYGLSGFCYYYYWFNGKRLLDMPLERMLKTGRPDFPFCLCWANENWTRTWDGMNQDVLIEQDYSDENDLKVIQDISRYFESENYIKVNDKPLLLVYRVNNFPLFSRTAEVWRNYARAAGHGEIMIASVESFELSANPEDPSKFGCDISVEFPPHGMVHDQPIAIGERNPEYVGSVHDYRALASEYMRREEPGWKRIRSLLVGWDNTPRRQNASLVLEHSTPGAFQAWLQWTISRTLEQNCGEERLVFINAWNEWCEGSYLEPDNLNGHGYLQALKNARDAIGWE